MEIQNKHLKFDFGVKYNHKRYKAFIKKLKRQKRRQEAAIHLKSQNQEAEIKLLESPGYAAWKECQARALKAKEEEDKKTTEKLKQEWLEREKKAREDFIAKKIKHQILEDKIRQNNTVPPKDRASNLSNNENVVESKDRPTHNPNAPPDYLCNDTDLIDCSYFTKTGVCKYGLRCKKRHLNPGVTDTLLFPNMYHDIQSSTIYDADETDMGLEYDDNEIYKRYKAFRSDVLPEFQTLGQVIQFVVCRNFEPHLMGNVYVQYVNEQCAQLAFQRFNGRYYAGKQLNCRFAHISKWKSTICGLFDNGRCPKGRTCNYLHVFKNSPLSLSTNREDTKSARSSHSSRSSRQSERDRNRDPKHRRDFDFKGKPRHRKESKRNAEELRQFSSVNVQSEAINHRLGDFWGHKELKLYYVKKNEESKSTCEGENVNRIPARKMPSDSSYPNELYQLSKQTLIRNLGPPHLCSSKKDGKSHKHRKHKQS